MRSREPVRIGPHRATAGSASIVQGVYGSRGNHEAVVPDAVDGLWVFWFNADRRGDPEQTPEVPPGTWSGGLAFAAGTRYRDAVVLQSTLGPDHLEVLALTADGVVESWWWSPGPGFQRRDGVVADGVDGIAAEHEAGVLRVTLTQATGAARFLLSPALPYPDRAWRAAASGPAPQDESAALALLNASGIMAVDGGTARVARSSRAGGTTELTWRSSGILLHLGVRTHAG